VTKRADASTLAVVGFVRENLPRFQSVLPEDIEVSYQFDQSPYVTRAIGGLAFEGALGAVLTGLMVLLFLRDWRSALVVVLNIPLAILAAAAALWVSGQTVNIMTLGGLALAVGILVDEATVTIENIHTHLARGGSLDRAAFAATSETTVPRFLAMLCILAVFAPAFFMTGAARSLFVPLSLAVGFSVVASYLLSSTFVPVLSVWALRMARARDYPRETFFDRLRRRYEHLARSVIERRRTVVISYLVVSVPNNRNNASVPKGDQ
jgi:multidrug efflux pump subunit AcrB